MRPRHRKRAQYENSVTAKGRRVAGFVTIVSGRSMACAAAKRAARLPLPAIPETIETFWPAHGKAGETGMS
jgi:hypothetical protein